MAFQGIGTGLGVVNNYDAATNTMGTGHNGMAYGHHSTDQDATDRMKSSTETSYQEKEEVEPIEPEVLRNHQITQLARQYTREREKESMHLSRTRSRQSRHSISASTLEQNPFAPEKDSILDPQSANFNSRAFSRALLNLESRDPANYKMRTAGFSFRNLNVHGFGSATDYQKTVGNKILSLFGAISSLVGAGKRKIDILQGLDGVVYKGEMLVVLGPPGSGCTTFLKTISGETHGFVVDGESTINYQGISPKQMRNDFRGEAIYTAEVDVHFPSMTVGDTLSFAAQARSPREIPGGVTRRQYSELMRNVTMAMFGILHTMNTKVGNDFVRGVSGGERKRVTIAEASLAGAPLQCWDNSTRGLDSANALEFVRTLRMSGDVFGTTAAVAIYQAPQSAYDIFDKVLVLYEGRQIYFGPAGAARGYFERLGYHCPDRQTTADFLTSMTSPAERVLRKDFEGHVPRTPDEYAKAWRSSPDYEKLMSDVQEYEQQHPYDGQALQDFRESRRMQQSKYQRHTSPYTLSYVGQVKLCLLRGFQRLKADPSLTLTQLFGNIIMALIIGSVFYNLQMVTSSFYSRSALLFFAILINAFASALEILTLYAQRPIVEKHSRYAFYHPSAEALASILTDMPYKIVNSILFNIVLYFLTNLRRAPGPFFFFCLISFALTLAMSMLFRTIGSVTRTLAQALAPTAVLILAIVIYTGFALPIPYMHGWARWINYLDLVGYAFESLMINEFHGRSFSCSSVIPSGPGYTNIGALQQSCNVVGAVAGSLNVDGTRYILESYQYQHSHKWRNLGIIIAFIVGLMFSYLIATEYISSKKSKGEVLVFRRGHVPTSLSKNAGGDVEAGPGASATVDKHPDQQNVSAVIERQTAIFQWHNVVYDIKIKGEERRILDHVDGWVKPGTLTALMGVSGAGKTTLLDVLATRTTMGVITGEMLVDGRPRDASFQRKTGYVQQQDLHLETTTVREALTFSSLLRQPGHISKAEKIAYVDEVIKLLEMEEYADAVVGVPGEGLNVEQRKRLTIGVELVAKPQLLLFLDEPTSGLDSQTSWAICDLMEKLTKSGQAILCTIHQPSAMLFQRFDRLLFLAKGGRTIYFGKVGQSSSTLTDYFQRNGAKPCPPDANPAEWMLEVIGAAPGSHSDIDWHQTWRASPEYRSVQDELEELKQGRLQQIKSVGASNKASYREFAAPFLQQYWQVQKRVFDQYWRTPVYIYSKFALCAGAALFVGFSFYRAGTSQQALQNQMFSVFMLLTIFGNLTQQIMPLFVTQRALYEVRERPSKTYSWVAFMLSNIVVELPWNMLAGVVIYFCWYYPIGYYRNAEPTGTVHERGALMFLFIEAFMVFTSTFAHLMISAMPTAETAGNVGNLMFSLSLIFCGVLASPSQFPRFWIFMYRVSPFTYLVDGMLSTGLANTNVVCAEKEFVRFDAPNGQTCSTYMADYLNRVGSGYLSANSAATSRCEFCTTSTTNSFLAAINSHYSDRWRNWGIMICFCIFNIIGAVLLYWIFRVPKAAKQKKTKKEDEKIAGTGVEKS